MEIIFQRLEKVVRVALHGRFDAAGSRDVDLQLNQQLLPSDRHVMLDMARVDYLSSAGLRIIVSLYQRLRKSNGAIAMVGLQPYCRDVLEMTGFSTSFPIFDSNPEAADFLEEMVREQAQIENWDTLETATLDCGTFRIIPQPAARSSVEVLGNVNNVLFSLITPNHLSSKNFFSTEYSIGLGGLGDRLEDYFPIMGEMITIGGTMVWLPTDGNDTPDFLIPRKNTGQITIRTAFNVSIAGGFNELMVFESHSPEGTTVDDLYRALYQLARTRDTGFRGVLGLAIRAQMPAVLGAGIKRSPLTEWAPENGEMILHSDNYPQWFDVDAAPRHRDVTGLICGLGIDLTADLSQYNQEQLHSVFYIHPTQGKGNEEKKQVLLHNHAVVFNPIPFPDRPVNFDHEIKTVVEQGDFIDMRHLLDRSTISKALIGVGYIQEFRRDPHGYRGVGG